jgi:hypothetical protein
MVLDTPVNLAGKKIVISQNILLGKRIGLKNIIQSQKTRNVGANLTKSGGNSRPEYKKYCSERYKRKREAEGKEVGVITRPTNFYAGYVCLGDATYFKIGITSRGSMVERYKKDPTHREALGDVIQLKWVECDSPEKALELEREHKSKCRTVLGEPAKGYEWFCIPNDAQLKIILEGE